MFNTIKNVHRLINRELPKEQLYDAKAILFHAKDDPAKKPSFQLDVLEPMFRELRQYAGGNRVYLGKQKPSEGNTLSAAAFIISTIRSTHCLSHTIRITMTSSTSSSCMTTGIPSSSVR